VAVVLETLKREKFARLSSGVLCYFLSLSSFFKKMWQNSHDHTRARTRAFNNLTRSVSSKHKLCKF
jgi:hypothetical protein